MTGSLIRGSRRHVLIGSVIVAIISGDEVTLHVFFLTLA